MAWGLVLRPALSCGDRTRRAVFAQRLVNVVHKISGWDCGWYRDDGVAVACSAQLVLRALEKLEANQIG